MVPFAEAVRHGPATAAPIRPGDEPAPSYTGIVEDLRRLREQGLTRIREAGLPELSAAARRAGYADDGAPAATAIERLVRAAVDRLGDGLLEQAAGYTFGVRPGFRSASAQERRKRAREIYGVSAERFRKAQERTVIGQVAEMVLALDAATVGRNDGAMPADSNGVPTTPARWVRTLSAAGHSYAVTLQIGPVELLRNVDVVVASTNVYFETSHTFRPSLSAALRVAAARRNAETGAIEDDTVGRELADGLARSGLQGLALPAGTVRVTSSGRLVERGIQRIFHAAVATPRPGANRYDVGSAAIAMAVGNVLRAARAERSSHPDLRSICFPLFGAGCGAVHRQQSLRWLLASLELELRGSGDPWELHVLSLRGDGIELAPWSAVNPG